MSSHRTEKGARARCSIAINGANVIPEMARFVNGGMEFALSGQLE